MYPGLDIPSRHSTISEVSALEEKEAELVERERSESQVVSKKRTLHPGLKNCPALKFITRRDLYSFLSSAGVSLCWSSVCMCVYMCMYVVLHIHASCRVSFRRGGIRRPPPENLLPLYNQTAEQELKIAIFTSIALESISDDLTSQIFSGGEGGGGASPHLLHVDGTRYSVAPQTFTLLCFVPLVIFSKRNAVMCACIFLCVCMCGNGSTYRTYIGKFACYNIIFVFFNVIS